MSYTPKGMVCTSKYVRFTVVYGEGDHLNDQAGNGPKNNQLRNGPQKLPLREGDPQNDRLGKGTPKMISWGSGPP